MEYVQLCSRIAIITKFGNSRTNMIDSQTPETKIITFISYQTLFNHVQKNGLLLPISYINSDENIDALIADIANDFESIEAISYSSFLNAMVQTYKADDIKYWGWNELKHCRLVSEKESKGIVFHRDNLLHMLGILIDKESLGTKKITGQKTFENAAEYYKALLLINSKKVFHPPEQFTEQTLLKDTFLRSYPYYYFPDIVESIYRVRLQRYWYIYHALIDGLQEEKINLIKDGLKKITESYSLSLNEYFYGLVGVFGWFLQTPVLKNADSTSKEAQKLGFNHKNLESFYIRRRNFGEANSTFTLVERLAKDLNGLKENLHMQRKDPLEGFYKFFRTFFDCPIYKIDANNYCIIDLKFLLEGICSGFLWKIKEISSLDIGKVKTQYGYLLEKYFVHLLKRIFGEGSVKEECAEGEPDAIVETDQYIIIFEFTIEYYRFTSLYSEDGKRFAEDVQRLLFNKGEGDQHSRKKKDKGKFFKLNSYVQKFADTKKTIIPILVTESYFGDSELLERFDGCISKGIEENGLNNLKGNTPLILNLDDIELFWRISNSKKAVEQFTGLINQWNQLGKGKGQYHFSFSYFISKSDEKIDNDFKNFFNWADFMDQIKTPQVS